MSDISSIVLTISLAASQSSGKERKLYHTLQDAVTSGSPGKMRQAQELYQRLDYGAQSRADSLLEEVSRYM